MAGRLICSQCYTAHKATRRNFPVDLVRTRMGKEETGGHICRKCASKNMVKDRPVGIGWRNALGFLAKKQKDQDSMVNFKPVKGDSHGNHNRNRGNFGGFLSRLGRSFGLKPA